MTTNRLPAKEEFEESTKLMADMCALFYVQLIRDHVPADAALEMSLEFTRSLMNKTTNSDDPLTGR